VVLLHQNFHPVARTGSGNKHHPAGWPADAPTFIGERFDFDFIILFCLR
jgi:hypothetical protein